MVIDELRKYCSDETIRVTSHALLKMRERKIRIEQVKQCILQGQIIEEYPDDHPFPSALVLAFESDTPIHVVAGIGEDELWIITAYYPDLNRWEPDFKTRKETEK